MNVSLFVLIARVPCRDGVAVFYGFDHGDFPDSTIANVGMHRNPEKASLFTDPADAADSADRLNANGVSSAGFVVERATLTVPN